MQYFFSCNLCLESSELSEDRKPGLLLTWSSSSGANLYTYISPSLPHMAPPSTAVGPPSETRTTSTLDCFTLLLARHLMDVSCYIGPSMPSGIYNIIQYNIGPEWHLFYVSGTSYRGDARGLWINASPRESSLVKFHLSEFRIWKGFSPWRNRGSVACHLLWMKTSTTYPKPQVASQHLDGTWTRRPSPLPTAMRAWYGEQPQGNNTPCRVPGANPGPSA